MNRCSYELLQNFECECYWSCVCGVTGVHIPSHCHSVPFTVGSSPAPTEEITDDELGVSTQFSIYYCSKMYKHTTFIVMYVHLQGLHMLYSSA